MNIDAFSEVVCPQDPVNVSSISENGLRKMAGNGMSLPSAGFCLLAMVLAFEDKA